MTKTLVVRGGGLPRYGPCMYNVKETPVRKKSPSPLCRLRNILKSVKLQGLEVRGLLAF